jgi:hypothetical protein
MDARHGGSVAEQGLRIKAGASLFLELGFPPGEAKRLQAASRKHINDTRLLKQKPKASPSDVGSSRRCGLKPAPR